MKDLVIVIITLAVVIVGAAIIYGRSLARTGRERKELHRRRVEDAEREEMMAENAQAWQRGEPPASNDGAPPFIWNRKYFRLYKLGAFTLGEAINRTRADAGYPPLEFKNGEDTKFYMDDDTTRILPGVEP